MLGYLALLAFAASASGSELARRDGAKYCPGGTDICFSESKIAAHDITFRVAIPETSAAPFDVLLSIIAPVSVAWAGLAWGGKMTQNPLTVAWPNGRGVVVSSRLATGRSLPGAYAGAAYTILPSSAVNATHWQLDALCRGCSKWSAASLDPNGVVTFAWAKGSRAPTTPSSNTSAFPYHDDRGIFSHDLASAKIPQGVFDALAYDLENGGGSPAAPSPTVATSSTLTGITTSVVTLPTPGLPTGGLPTSGLPTTDLPTASLPIATLPTAELPTGATIISTRIVTLPAPPSAAPPVPTRLTTLLPPQPEQSTSFVVITRVSTISLRPPTPPSPKPSDGGVVTVTVTRTSSAAASQPQPTQWQGPPWRGGKGKGKGKWGGGGGRGRGRPWDEEGEEWRR